MPTGQVYQSLHKATNSRTPPLKQEKQLQNGVQKRKENSLHIQWIFAFDFGTNHDAVKVGLISESFPHLL